jgi:predicted ribosomally synthesized peptide with nif11-like leader
MTVGDARKFIRRAATDSQLRDQLNDAPTWDAMAAILEAHQFRFTPVDFDKAYHGVLVQCLTETEAASVRELKSWWDFLMAAATR